MFVRIDAAGPRRLLPLALTGIALMGVASLAGADPAEARHGHKEHTIYGSISGYQTVMDRNTPEYQAADAFCQTQTSVDSTVTGSPVQGGGANGNGMSGGGNQFQRLKYTYAACMASRGAWERITPTAVGDQPSP
jgi:hypothetical protein